MTDSSNKTTICEKLRDINDLCQGSNSHDKQIRKLLAECEVMAKKMSNKLLEYNQEIFVDYWKDNPDKLEKIKLRQSKHYLTGDK